MGLLKRWLPSQADLDHVRQCKGGASACHVCLYLRLKQQGRYPWLDQEKSGVGCRVCNGAGVNTCWARFSMAHVNLLQTYRLKLHESSVQHQSCKADLVVDGRVAPRRSVFKDVLDAVKSSIYSGKAIAAKCGSWP
jgi:hypothetical protein